MVDAAVGATTGLLALGIMAGVAGKMIGGNRGPRGFRGPSGRIKPIRHPKHHKKSYWG